MTLRILLLVLLLVPTFLGGIPSESGAQDLPVEKTDGSPMDQLLASADALLAQGEFEQAETLLSEGLVKLSGELSMPQKFTLHYAIALVCVRTANEGAAISNFVEAIALADQLERGTQAGFDGLALSLRLELADFLLDSGKASDSEALCWDALMRVVEKEDAGGLGRVVVALVSAVLPQTNDEDALRAFLAELDTELARWDGYRLSLPPPPEPIFELLDEGAARLMAENQTEAARRLFEGVLRLDRARGAEWRIVQDLSSVAFSALLLDDLPAARSALDEALAEAAAGPIPVNVWANRCYLAAFEGDWAVAEAHCLGGIAAARSSGDERRAIAMTSVLAGLRAFAGQARKAVNLHEDAAQRYDQLGASQDAAGERARAVMVLTEGRDLDEALRLLQRLDAKREGEPQHPLVEEARQRLALEMLLSSFESADDEEVRSALHSIGDHLFKTGRSVSLTELSLLYLDLVFRSGSVVGGNEDLEEAVLAIVGLERELGLQDSGWVGIYAQAVLHTAKEERAEAAALLLSVLDNYEDRLLSDALGGDALRVWMGRGQSRFYRRPRLEPHRRLIEELLALDRRAEAREIERRMKRVEEALLWRQPAAAKVLRPRTPLESHYLSVRAERLSLEEHLMAVSLRGGEVAPEDQRAAAAPLLSRLREAEVLALKALSTDRVLLFDPGAEPAAAGPPPRCCRNAEEWVWLDGPVDCDLPAGEPWRSGDLHRSQWACGSGRSGSRFRACGSVRRGLWSRRTRSEPLAQSCGPPGVSGGRWTRDDCFTGSARGGSLCRRCRGCHPSSQTCSSCGPEAVSFFASGRPRRWTCPRRSIFVGPCGTQEAVAEREREERLDPPGSRSPCAALSVSFGPRGGLVFPVLEEPLSFGNHKLGNTGRSFRCRDHCDLTAPPVA